MIPVVEGRAQLEASSATDFIVPGSWRFRSDTMRCKDLSLVRCWLPTLGMLLVPLSTAQAAAASTAPPQPFSLSWQAPEGCPESLPVEQEITSALAHLRGRGAVDVVASVTLRESEPGFWLRVKVVHAGQVGERVLPIDDCVDATRAAALLVALAVENVPQQVKVEEKVERKVEAPKPKPLPLSVGVGPQLAMGLAPELSAGIGVSLSYSRAFWRLSARGAAFAPSHHTIAGSPVGGSFELMTAGAFACAGYPGLPFTFYGCLGGRFDHLKGTGTGASRNSSATTQIGSVAAGVTLEWSLTRRFRLRSELEAGYPLGDARFVIANQAEPVHEVDSLRGEAGLELAVAF
jgi:hypothetical protein